MSCEIRPIGKFPKLDECKEWLFHKGNSYFDNWLQECLISFSPTGEILAIAKGQNLIILTSKWDSTESSDVKMKYNITWEGNPCPKSGDITSVLCLPLISHGQSASGTDWTCIVVGFSSGMVKFYTENMYQLVSEVLHAEPVTHIKCNSLRISKKGNSNISDQESGELIYVLYKSVMCVINGFSLIQTLRGSRNRLARQSASLQSLSLDDSLPVDFKKYGFSDQDAITDACFIGQTTINIFDHLLTASVAGGFYSSYRPSPPQSSLIIATGRKPFLAFHYTVEGGGNPALADVALAVASKIKESVTATLPYWLGFNNKANSVQQKQKISQEPIEQLGCRFGLCDLWRHGNSIIMTPDGKLSAVTDSLGRILLIENSSGIARRLWKGYREAQCGFLDAEEDVDKARHRKTKFRENANTVAARRAIFIVIYAPKKGLIEIFGVYQGPCIASFKVSKNGRLIYTPYGLLGLSNPPKKGFGATQYTVVFLSEDGLKEVIVPFHCRLGDDNMNKARDIHILKKMKIFLKVDFNEDAKSIDKMKTFAQDLKTDEIKMQALEMLILNKQINAETFKAVLNQFTEDFQKKDNSHNLKSLIVLTEALKNLIDLYIFLIDLNNQPPNYNAVVNSECNESSLADKLVLTNKEMSSMLKTINLIKEMDCKNSRNIKVTFMERCEKTLNLFLSYFDFNNLINSSATNDEEAELCINFKSDLTEEKMAWIGEFLFSGIFYSNQWVNDWKSNIDECKLDQMNLIKCLLSYWLSKNIMDNWSYEITSLLELLKIICSLVGPDAIYVDYNEESNWWKNIRNFLKCRECSIANLLAAIACRAETIAVEQTKELTQTCSGKKINYEVEGKAGEPKDDFQGNDWENVSQDTLQWDILLTKIEDIATLNAVLSMNLKNDKPCGPQLDFHFQKLSLNSVLYKGNGFISELVAKWLTQFVVDVENLIDQSDVEFNMKKVLQDDKNSSSTPAKCTAVEECDQALDVRRDSNIKDYIGILKRKFPFSLTSSVLLSNICWEYMTHWYTNTSRLSYLECAMYYLRGIPSSSLKLGLSYLSWTTYFVHKFSSVAKLIDKFEKLPNDKICTQEVNFTSLQVTAFLKLSNELLNIMLETGNVEKMESMFNEEAIWQNEPIGNIPSLATLAESQPELNSDLVVLHYQLSMTLCMISELDIKNTQALRQIFDQISVTKLFTDLTKSSQFSSHSCNAMLRNVRMQFLYKVIVKAVQKIEIVEDIPAFPVTVPHDNVPRTCMNVEKATELFGDCYCLAQMWDLPLDSLRRHLVCELYSHGYDRLAEETLSAINDTTELSSKLLVLTGEKLKIYIDNSSSYWKKLSILSPDLANWLKNLNSGRIKNQNISLFDIQTMLSFILKCQTLNTRDAQLALSMVESIPALENDSSI